MQVCVVLAGDAGGSPAFNADGYEPSGRAEDGLRGEHPMGGGAGGGHKHGGTGSSNRPVARPHTRESHPEEYTDSGRRILQPEEYKYGPAGRTYDGGSGGHTYAQGSAETDAAIVNAAHASGQDPNFMRGVASIESGMNPSSNANRSTQYKGLYQIGSRGNDSEWGRFGEGNIYSARDNAMATARIWNENSKQFKKRFGREPTETEHYLMHQQGLGFYTRGAMTNISGNPYPGMRGPQNHDSFEAGWGRELARRKAAFSKMHPEPPAPAADVPPAPPGLGGGALPAITVDEP